MANLRYILEEIDSLSSAERLKVMERILMHLRSEHETAETVKSIRLTGRAGVYVGKPQLVSRVVNHEDLSANPYDMKGLGA